jgi:hypothetical protein
MKFLCSCSTEWFTVSGVVLYEMKLHIRNTDDGTCRLLASSVSSPQRLELVLQPLGPPFLKQ